MRASIALLALVSMNAFANSGVGYFMVAMPIVALALIPAILLEAPVLGYLLKLPLRRAALLSLRANLASTLVGFVAGLAVDLALSPGGSGFPPVRASVAIMLVPWFFFSWWIEHLSVAKRAAELPRQAVLRATGVANLLSYVLMLAVALMSPLFPARDTSLTRAKVSEAVVVASGMRGKVDEFWEARNTYPAGPSELGSQPPISGRHRVTLERDGRIVVQFVATNDVMLDGKHVELIPHADPTAPSSGLKWICRSADIDDRYLPVTCRTPAR